MNKYEKREKEFLKLCRRRDELFKLSRSLPWIKLEEPYQRGWEILPELRTDIKRRLDSGIIQKALDLIAVSYYTRDPKLVGRVRRGETNPTVQKNWTGWRGVKRQAISQDVEKFFCHLWWLEKKRDLYYPRLPEYWITWKVKPYMITHTRVNIYKAEMDEIDDELARNKYAKARGRHWHRHNPKYDAGGARTEVRGNIAHFLRGNTEFVSEHDTRRREWD